MILPTLLSLLLIKEKSPRQPEGFWTKSTLPRALKWECCLEQIQEWLGHGSWHRRELKFPTRVHLKRNAIFLPKCKGTLTKQWDRKKKKNNNKQPASLERNIHLYSLIFIDRSPT